MQIIYSDCTLCHSEIGLEDAPSPILAFVKAGVWSLNKADSPATVQIPILNAGTLNRSDIPVQRRSCLC